jgi:hypothetical protein
MNVRGDLGNTLGGLPLLVSQHLSKIAVIRGGCRSAYEQRRQDDKATAFTP